LHTIVATRQLSSKEIDGIRLRDLDSLLPFHLILFPLFFPSISSAVIVVDKEVCSVGVDD
jgi:hypothetical protein